MSITIVARFILISVWIAGSFLVGLISRRKSTGFLRAFILSVLLSPVAGMAAFMLSGPKIVEEQSTNEKDYYLCVHCNYVSNARHRFCEKCGKDFLGRTKDEVGHEHSL